MAHTQRLNAVVPAAHTPIRHALIIYSVARHLNLHHNNARDTVVPWHSLS